MSFSKTNSIKKLNSFDSIITFGKYEGCTIREIYKTDASYLLWAIENTDRFSLSEDDIDKISEKAEKQDRDYYLDMLDDYDDPYDHYDDRGN